MIDDALGYKKRILKNESPQHCLYGGIELEKKGKAKIVDSKLKELLKLKRGDIVVTNRWRYIIHMKTIGVKVVLINMNSNHDLTREDGMRSRIKHQWTIRNLKLCDAVICLSEIQVPKLEEIGVYNIFVIPLGVDSELINTFDLSSRYYLTSGGDLGKDYKFVVNALPHSNLKVVTGKPYIPYKEYLEIMSKAKALILHVDNNKNSSDLSSSTACFEAMLMKKPVFINKQPWLKELLKNNYYIYNDESELRELLRKDIKFIEEDYSHLTLDIFTKRLVEVINKL